MMTAYLLRITSRNGLVRHVIRSEACPSMRWSEVRDVRVVTEVRAETYHEAHAAVVEWAAVRRYAVAP